jgi:hypothetical protein
VGEDAGPDLKLSDNLTVIKEEEEEFKPNDTGLEPDQNMS